MEDVEKRFEESVSKLNSLEAEVYVRALNQEVDKFIAHSERQTSKFLTAIKIGMICITALVVVWEVLYMLIKGLQM